ncbi:zinc finger matrin-type protein 5 isoform X2 [Rhinatrema bivittatum]|uniref:zinc finger matrin-type protein 5 isoform X2 n=1 Tax=Rhinatrema bivittatum TaxID=194408 RepID=UPI001126008A|nr:zinc finger matrin-type protein 5 isoform X2 [Rhinatrema bivittatum]
MGKRYFCDYCDRSFQDNLHNRKKHLNGVQHQRCKKVWYDMFRDASTVLAEEKTKKPCRKFLQTGQCDFGSNCRFSHLSEKDIERLMSQVEEERKAKEHQEEKGDKASDCQIEDWLERRTKRKKSARNNRSYMSAIEEVKIRGRGPGAWQCICHPGCPQSQPCSSRCQQCSHS